MNNLLEYILTGKKGRPRIATLYGVPGIGKSTWAASAPNPIFVQTERGADDIGVPRFPVAPTWPVVRDVLNSLLAEDHDFKTMVLDSLSALEPLIWQQVCTDKGKANIEDIGYAKGYIFALSYWGELMSLCEKLQAEKGMNIVLIGHSKVQPFNDPEGDSYDLYDMDIHRKAAGPIFRWSDEVFFANYKVYKKKEGEGTKQRSVGIGGDERVLYTEERPSRKAKNRLGMPAEIPMLKENGWAEYAKYTNTNNDQQ